MPTFRAAKRMLVQWIQAQTLWENRSQLEKVQIPRSSEWTSARRTLLLRLRYEWTFQDSRLILGPNNETLLALLLVVPQGQ